MKYNSIIDNSSDEARVLLNKAHTCVNCFSYNDMFVFKEDHEGIYIHCCVCRNAGYSAKTPEKALKLWSKCQKEIKGKTPYRHAKRRWGV